MSPGYRLRTTSSPQSSHLTGQSTPGGTGDAFQSSAPACLGYSSVFFCFVLFCLFFAFYGDSQARGQIRATATRIRAESVTYTTLYGKARSLTP